MANVLSAVGGDGVSTQTAPSNIEASAPSNPSSSLPAIGWPPTNRGSSMAAQIAALDTADIGDQPGGLGERPLDLIDDRQHRRGDERDVGVGVEAGGIDGTHRQRPSSAPRRDRRR